MHIWILHLVKAFQFASSYLLPDRLQRLSSDVRCKRFRGSEAAKVYHYLRINLILQLGPGSTCVPVCVCMCVCTHRRSLGTLDRQCVCEAHVNETNDRVATSVPCGPRAKASVRGRAGDGLIDRLHQHTPCPSTQTHTSQWLRVI